MLCPTGCPPALRRPPLSVVASCICMYRQPHRHRIHTSYRSHLWLRLCLPPPNLGGGASSPRPPLGRGIPDTCASVGVFAVFYFETPVPLTRALRRCLSSFLVPDQNAAQLAVPGAVHGGGQGGIPTHYSTLPSSPNHLSRCKLPPSLPTCSKQVISFVFANTEAPHLLSGSHWDMFAGHLFLNPIFRVQ